ncbi:duf1748 containing protein [Glarea lozoyensis ATCC 20868]|uniref:Duf1748 containing protein n=1 Tax=Glarea lozoyensis (strain ATCC 20868 / MF5171) TaxID=1116229 RepID=S3DCS8_GLAL2|nr:duf1748 containing protein [Glarea lozoyensis ATCC 20868]EPE35540.1 duf1748 containing protein [Glarea lozoyensis ATCC 20868]
MVLAGAQQPGSETKQSKFRRTTPAHTRASTENPFPTFSLAITHTRNQQARQVTMVFLNLLTFGLWGKLGRLTHYAFDAVLISTILAGMKRSTGLTPSFKKESISENKDVNVWIGKYLDVGEWVMDTSVALAGSSGFFERKR